MRSGLAGLGSLDPNVLPLDAIELQEESSTSKIIAGRDEWRFGSAISGSKWVTGREYKAGDIVWNPADKLTYVALADNASVEPDYTDTGVEGVTWGWVAGSITGFVSGRGWWQKHADGTLVQWGSFTNINLGTGVQYGQATYTAPGWVLPVSFASPDYYANASARVSGRIVSSSLTDTHSVSQTTFYLIDAFSNTPYAVTALRLDLFAIGRWKA